MTGTVKRTVHTGEWADVTRALEAVRKDLRRDLKKLEAQATIDRESLDNSLRGIVDVLEEGFAAAAKSVRDPALRKHLVDVAKAIRAALRQTASRGALKATRPTTSRPGSKAKAHARGTRPANRQTRKA
jgi:uncharacterized linocin/CFP29 family protein